MTDNVYQINGGYLNEKMGKSHFVLVKEFFRLNNARFLKTIAIERNKNVSEAEGGQLA